jgi:hypothetical protein
MRRRLAVPVLLLTATFTLVACGDDSGGGSGRDAVIERLEQEGESPESAACFADELSEFSIEDIEAFLDGDAENEDLDAAVLAAVETCSPTVTEGAE